MLEYVYVCIQHFVRKYILLIHEREYLSGFWSGFAHCLRNAKYILFYGLATHYSYNPSLKGPGAQRPMCVAGGGEPLEDEVGSAVYPI